jgi:hypothetical protein
MGENKIAIFVISVTSITFWGLLSHFNLISGKMLTVLIVLSVLVIAYSLYFILNDFKSENKYFTIVFFTFFVYELITVVRGFTFSYGSIKDYLQTGYLFWPFIIPLFVFFNKKLSTIGLLLKWIFLMALPFMFMFFIFPKLLLTRTSAENLVAPTFICGFLFLNSNYLSNKKVNVIFLIMIISLVSVTYVARRNCIATLIGFIVSGYFLNILYKHKSTLFKFMPVLIISIFFFFSYFSNLGDHLTMKLKNRMTEDTRSKLYELYLYEMKDHLVFGKGMNGVYFFPMARSEVEEGVVFDEVVYRNVIENGYLQLLLTGGIIHIILFLLVLIPAAFLGIFKSSNQLSVASGALILLWMVDMLIYGLPTLNLHYIIVWICVGICYKSSIRDASNEEIREQFLFLR